LEKNVGKSCSTCGQVFDPSIAFCPTDGTKLSTELVTASSHELIQVTSRHLLKKQDGAGKPENGAKNDAATRVSSPQIVLNAPAQNRDDTPDHKFGNKEDSRKKSTFFDTDPNDSDDGDELRDTRSHLVPTLLGKTLDNQYEIVSLIGKGGMSFVYKAKHLLMKKTVAIKTLLPHLSLNAISLQRFQQEAQAASNLKHPNIIAVYNFGTTPDGEPYLVMDYVEGSSIADELEKNGIVPVERAVDIFVQVADALAHAHQRGIIHRDLKPSNILLLEKDGVKDHVNIVDFGIAKMLPQDGAEAISLTQTGEVFGSPLYMSPEQCRGEKLDNRADIYSMGCLMYETLTGRPAISGDNTMEVLYNHLHEIPAPMKAPLTYIPPQLEKIVFKTLAKDPAQRYQNMGQLRDELKDFSLRSKTNVINKVSNAWQLFWLRRKPRTRRDKIIAAVAVSGFLCAAFFAYQLATLYLAAADSPASKQALVWDEDREALKPIKEGIEDSKARFDVMFHARVAASMEEKHAESTEIINYLSGPAEYLAKRHLWKSALEMYELAYKYSVKYNDYLSLRTMTLRLAMAECNINLQQYEEGARIIDEMMRKLFSGAQRDYVDQSILEAKLGTVFYLEGKWNPALQYMGAAYKTWTEKHAYTLPFTFYSLPTNLESNYDFTLLVSRMATSYQRLYQLSVASGTPDMRALKESVRLYNIAVKQWGHLVGDHESNRNGTVALANYVFLAHTLDKSTDLDSEYSQLIQRIKEFGTDSAYEGVVLLNYSQYLIDKGRFFEAATNRIHAWRIFALLAKSEGNDTSNGASSEATGKPAPVVGK
jgi:serine/threonine protein kinase